MNNSCHLQILDILQESPDLIEIYLKYVIDNKIIHTSSCNFTCYPMHLSKNITDYLVMYIGGFTCVGKNLQNDIKRWGSYITPEKYLKLLKFKNWVCFYDCTNYNNIYNNNLCNDCEIYEKLWNEMNKDYSIIKYNLLIDVLPNYMCQHIDLIIKLSL